MNFIKPPHVSREGLKFLLMNFLSYQYTALSSRAVHGHQMYFKLEIGLRSVERGICPIATSTMTNCSPIIMAHERKGYMSTSGLKSDVTVVFLDPDFL